MYICRVFIPHVMPICSADPDYVSSKIQLTNQKAIQAYEKALKATYIYRYAESYCRVCVS